MSRTISRRRIVATRAALGERNNNPGNIRFLAARAWNGQLPEPGEGGFGAYETPEHGIRAMLLQMRKHLVLAPTLGAMINKWAPPTENPTLSYIKRVETATGLSADHELDPEDAGEMLAVAMAMAEVENNYLPWDEETWERGATMAYHPGRRPGLMKSRTAIGGTAGAAISGIASMISADDARNTLMMAADAGKGIPWMQIAPAIMCIICTALCVYVVLVRRQDWKDGLN